MVKNLGTGYTTVERDKDSAANYMCAVIQTHPHKGTHSLCSFQAESLRLSVWTREHRPSNQPGLPKILYSLIKCSRTVPLIAAQLLLLYTQAWFLTLVGFVWSHVTNIHWQFDIFITMNIVIHTTSKMHELGNQVNTFSQRKHPAMSPSYSQDSGCVTDGGL